MGVELLYAASVRDRVYNFENRRADRTYMQHYDKLEVFSDIKNEKELACGGQSINRVYLAYQGDVKTAYISFCFGSQFFEEEFKTLQWNAEGNGTRNILKKLVVEHPELHSIVFLGHSMGASLAFMNLLYACEERILQAGSRVFLCTSGFGRFPTCLQKRFAQYGDILHIDVMSLFKIPYEGFQVGTGGVSERLRYVADRSFDMIGVSNGNCAAFYDDHAECWNQMVVQECVKDKEYTTSGFCHSSELGRMGSFKQDRKRLPEACSKELGPMYSTAYNQCGEWLDMWHQHISQKIISKSTVFTFMITNEGRLVTYDKNNFLKNARYETFTIRNELDDIHRLHYYIKCLKMNLNENKGFITAEMTPNPNVFGYQNKNVS
jgi:hypothetical protein